MWNHSPLRYCQWECEMIQHLFRTIWQFFIKWGIHLAYGLTPGHLPRWMKTYIHTKTSTQIFIATLLIIGKNWKQCVLQWMEWINRQWHSQTTRHDSAMKRNELLTQDTTQDTTVDLNGRMRSEGSQPRKIECYMGPFLWNMHVLEKAKLQGQKTDEWLSGVIVAGECDLSVATWQNFWGWWNWSISRLQCRNMTLYMY